MIRHRPPQQIYGEVRVELTAAQHLQTDIEQINIGDFFLLNGTLILMQAVKSI